MPTCAIYENLMDPGNVRVTLPEVGTPIKTLCPQGPFPYVCNYNGQWILRADWERGLEEGDKVAFFAYPPQGGGDGGSNIGRVLLTIVSIYLALEFGVPPLESAGLSTAQATAVATVLATTAVNLLVPVQAGSDAVTSAQSSSPNYSVALQSNQPRLDQAIPVLYGRNKTYPDFAGEPYSEYTSSDDQYYYALLCLGQGKYSIETQLLDDTNLNNFADVIVNNILPPGTLPSTVRANVVNSVEIAGGALNDARYSGAYVGCKPKQLATEIGIDITLSRGLADYDAGTGNPTNKTVGWRVEYRAVDDFGVGLTPWTTLATESLTLAQTKPVRRSYRYKMADHSPTNWPAVYQAVPIRPQVRLTRTTPFDSNLRAANTIEWAGLKCFLSAPAPLCATATHIEIVMRASEQLSGLSQRKMAVISQRLLRTWSPGGGWTTEVPTRNYCWALADKWTNQVYGDKYPDAQCDLATLAVKAAVADTRQDRFDAVFDQTYESFQADQMIAQSGRAAAFRRNGVMTISRDEQQDLPATAFTARNIAPGSISMDYGLAVESTPDGLIVEYLDNRSWDWVSITCPAPGVTTPTKPQRLRLFGVTGSFHAKREGYYHAANAFYRRKLTEHTTELEGIIPAFGSAVVFAPSMPGWHRAGELVTFNGATNEAIFTEPIAWVTGATHYVTFLNRDGSLSLPYIVTAGSTEFSARFASSPLVEMSTNIAAEERTKYFFGVGQPYENVIRVLGLRSSMDDKGVVSYSVSGVLEDSRVHTADNAFLPTGGEIQDPVDNAANSEIPSSIAVVPYLVPGNYSHSVSAIAGTADIKITLDNAGVAFLTRSATEVAAESFENLVNQWLLGGPWTSTETVLFEARLTVVAGSTPSGSATASWLALDTSRAWDISASGEGASNLTQFLLEIREVATGIVQASAMVYMDVSVGVNP